MVARVLFPLRKSWGTWSHPRAGDHKGPPFPSAPHSPIRTIWPGFLYCLEIKYTLTMINIPPTMVVGSS